MSERFIYKPRNGVDVLRAAPRGTKIFRYNELGRTPDVALRQLARDNIILLENPDKPNTGHWLCLKMKPEKRQAYFFNSYGGMPDRKKHEWLTPSKLRVNRQDTDILNDTLKQLALNGWEVHYNDVPYQVEGDKTATCGIWCAAFLNSDENPDEFAANHLPIEYYYRKLF